MFSGSAAVVFIAAAKFLFHLLTANRYGIFRDELYYLACAEHLDWGYVDQPPLIALITFLSTRAFGTSLLGLRFLPALAGAGLIWLTGSIAQEIGGGRTAQALAAVAVALAPIYLLMHHWMTTDEFGWEDMTREVARIYNGLPADRRASTAVFANGYGQAGAIDFFGAKYGLPKAIGNHQNYWLWGPREYTGEIVIVLGSDGTGDREHFNSVEVVGRAQHPFSRLDEHFDIFLCRGLKSDLRSFWPQIKNWN